MTTTSRHVQGDLMGDGEERALRRELEQTRARLAEAEEMLAAIRTGQVDALLVCGPDGERVYTLQGAETPYRVLVEQMQEGAVVVGPDGVILYGNRRFADMVGLPLERVIGQSMASMAFGNDSRNLLRLVEAARTTTAKRELTLRGPAGSRGVPVYVAASPLPADQGGRTCIIVTDLTAQKRTRELEEAQEALARKAGELTRSNADLSNFAHVAAHDLKEPLRGIRHIVGFLLEDYGHTLGTDGRGRLASLDRLTGRMHALLDSLLEYSRVGQEQLIAQPTDLNQVLGDVLAALGPWLRERDAIPAAGPLPTVSCDPVLVGRLFQNLITNGVKYNDSSPRRVEIGALSHTAIPVLYVRDNGIGIPPEHHQTVFRMFKRLSRDERHGGGTGAGLAIAKKIVEHHSGRIWVESLPGEGSTFYFTLGPPPLSPWSAEAAIKDSAAPPIGQAAPDAAMPEGSAARESAGPPA